MSKSEVPATMRAARIYEFGAPDVIKIEEVPVPEPGPGEVLLRINAIAINSWDIRLRSGNAPQVPGRPPTPLPFQLGREGAGEIVAIGPGFTRRKVGDRVVMMANPACGRCHYCRKRGEHLCVATELPGHTRFGSYAQYVVVPEHGVISSPENLTDEELAPLLWAYGTALHGIKPSGIEIGDVVVVTGAAGSVGIASLQLARLAGAGTVIGISRSPDKVKQLRELGFDEVVNHLEPEGLARVRELAHGIGADIVIDNYGSADTIDFAIDAADLGATIVLAASALDKITDTLPIREMPVFAKSLSIIGTRASTPREQESVVELAAAGKISMPVAKVFPFDEIVAAHELMEQGKHVGKIVLTLQ